MRQLLPSIDAVFLSLGLTSASQKLHPAYFKSIPIKINKNQSAIDCWNEARKSTEHLPGPDAWKESFVRYIRLCNAKRINPFAHTADRTDNNQIAFSLRHSRRKAVKYIDSLGLLSKYKVQWNSEALDFIDTEQGFKLRSKITLQNVDFLELKSLLEPQMFFKYDGPYRLGKWDWRKPFNPYNLVIGVSVAGNFEAYLWYEITLGTDVYVNYMQNRDMDSQLKKAVETMWFTVARTIKFQTLKRISMF